MDAVAVPFALCVEPGVEPGLGFGQSHHTHIPGQIAIDVVHNFPGRQGMLQGEGCHLAQSVDPGVGAARAADLHFPAVELLEDGLQLLLDGVFGVALLLPAIVFGTLVLEGHAIILFHKAPPRRFFLYYTRFPQTVLYSF